jgi:hypothetical protein
MPLSFLIFLFFFEVASIIFFGGRLSSWVKIRLHTENELPMLSVSARPMLLLLLLEVPNQLHNNNMKYFSV